MSIEVGLGAAGRDQDLAAMTQLAQVMTMIVGQQGGADGPIVTLANAYNAAIDLAKALGRRQPERYFTNPASLPAAALPGDGTALASAQSQQAVQQQAQALAVEAQLQARDQNLKAGLALQKTRVDAALKKYAIDQQARTEIVTSAMKSGAIKAGA